MIWGFHCGGYEKCHRLGRGALWVFRVEEITQSSKPLRLISTPTVWTDMLVFVSASRVSLSSGPSRNLHNRTSIPATRSYHPEHLPRGYYVCPLGAVFQILSRLPTPSFIALAVGLALSSPNNPSTPDAQLFSTGNLPLPKFSFNAFSALRTVVSLLWIVHTFHRLRYFF
jgi:hypothetical protein